MFFGSFLRGAWGASRMKKLKEVVLSGNPYCIYCGGDTPATSLDHVPSRAMFTLRGRPQGLEFSACDHCNNISGRDELVAAFLSRVSPDPETDTEKDEMRRLVSDVSKNFPDLLEEMKPSLRQSKLYRNSGFSLGGGALNCRGVILNKSINRFAAKTGFALHYQLTKRIVPKGGAAYVQWYTNYNGIQGDLPHELISFLGDPTTLMQGKWEVRKQFLYSSKATEDGQMSAHFASFRQSFAICAFVVMDTTKIEPPDTQTNEYIYRAGFLKTPE